MVCALGGGPFSLKRKEFLPRAAMWADLEDITPSKMSQSHEGEYCVTSLLSGSRAVEFLETGGGGTVVARGQGVAGREWGVVV